MRKPATLLAMKIRTEAKRGELFLLSCLLVVLVLSSCHSRTRSEHYSHVDFQDIRIHYTLKGEGFPLIVIHGSLTDLRYWKEQEAALSENHTLISYSRRYNYPNQNKVVPNHSAIVEANDLLSLMDKLNIKQAHILGHSYGAYTALLFALENPERVNKLILAEPPLMRWLPYIPGGDQIMESFMRDTWIPMGRIFSDQGEKAGIEASALWSFGQPLDSIPTIWKTYFIDNAKEWQALTTSADAFPMLDFEDIRNLTKPTLLLSGALNSGNYNDLIDGHLGRLLPDKDRIIIENAGHEMFLDNARETNRAILDFLHK